MKMESKFDLNQKVFYIKQDRKREWQICSGCSGKGRIILEDKSDILCPKCYGRKGEDRYLDKEWMIVGELTIGQIRVVITNIEKDDIFDNVGAYKEGKTVKEEEYMCYESGIRSGSVYKAEMFRATEKEALEECEKLNKSLLKGVKK